MSSELSVDGRSLTVDDVTRLAVAPARVLLDDDAWARVRASHQAAVEAVARRPVYGRSTGVGANRSEAVRSDPAAAAEHALALLRSHATSAGPRRSDERIRGMLLVRLNQLAVGGSGISPAAVAALAAMIDADALPPVRELGGIGTGDLPALATTALGLLGEVPLTRPLPIDSTDSTDSTGYRVQLGVHDALPFISSNAATLADAALATHRLRELAWAGVGVAALTGVAVRANLEAFDPVIEQGLPGAGGAAVCRTVRRLLTPAGVPLDPARIQDPFALRCLPQVNGSVLDALIALEASVTAHLNLTTENPLILPATPVNQVNPVNQAAGAGAGVQGARVLHHGGFHLVGLALACDGASLAVASSMPLLLGRLAMLIDPGATGLPPFLGDGRPGASGVMLLEFIAGSSLAVLRSAAVPASLGTVSISRGAEEDASFASRAAVQLFEAADAYATALACELVAAVRAIRMRGLTVPDTGWGEVLAACAPLPAEVADRDLTGDIALAERLLPALAGIARQAG